MKCPYCEATITPGKRFCTECGRYLPAEVRNSAEAEQPTVPEAEPVDESVIRPETSPETQVTADEVISEAVSAAENADTPENAQEPVSSDVLPEPESVPAEPDPLPEASAAEAAEASPSVAASDEPVAAASVSQEPSAAASEESPDQKKEDALTGTEHLSVMPTDPNKPATADLMIPVGPDPKPDKNSRWAPVDTWGWLGIRLVMLVPILNIVLLLVWSFGGTGKNVKQSWARATLVWVLLIMILLLGAVLYILIHPSLALTIANSL